MPDYESLEEVVHLYGEATTFARLTWNPQYDLALERRLWRVRCPALVIGAEDDRVIPNAVADKYAELIAGARGSSGSRAAGTPSPSRSRTSWPT